MATKSGLAGLILLCIAMTPVTHADLKLSRYFSDNMVLQRDKPVNVWGTAKAGANVTVAFGGQKKTAAADKGGNWVVTLNPMKASARGQELKVSGDGSVALRNVVVGDVWFFGRQSYIDVSLDRTDDGKAAAASFKPNKMFRAITIKTVPTLKPQNDLDKGATSGWMQVDGKNALTMTASAFLLGRDLVKDLGVPVGIVDVKMDRYFGIGWLSEKALADAATLNPKSKVVDSVPKWMRERAEARISGKAQKDLDEYYKAQLAKSRGKPVRKPSLGLHPLENPMCPSVGYNAVINPLKNITLKGVLLQLGNDYPFVAYRELDKNGTATVTAELDAAWQENYMILKNGYWITDVTLPYVPGDWRRTFGDKKLPVGLILPPASDLDVYAAHNREIRELHRRTASKAEGIGLIIPGMKNIPSSGQPADEKLLAERCKQWVLSAVCGKGVPATGPLFDRVAARISKATIYFKEGTAKGLKASAEALNQFETAGPDRVFTKASAKIDGSTIKLKSDGPIQFVRFNWSEKPNQGLVNSAGLPALPFNTDADWKFAWIPPPSQPNLPMEYRTTANKWGKSSVAIINGQIANMAQGDSEQIPRRPGPLGLVASPFGPNIYVVGTEPGPAAGKLFTGDVIYGVNGKVFDDTPGAAPDGQYKMLAAAIGYSESDEGQGKLVLSLRRGLKLMDVELKLQVLGSYSSTTPYYCEKSENIVKNAEAWSAKQYRPQTGLPSQPYGMLNTDLLFLLASGTPEHQGLVRRAIYAMMAKMDPKPVVLGMQSKPWTTGYTSLLFGEYYHATGDRNILPYLKYQADLSAESQIKPKSETPPNKEAAQTEEQVGGWRQNYPGRPDRWKSGYGLMPHAGMSCVMGMELAKEAGLKIDDLALRRGLKHFDKNRAEYGAVIYTYAGGRRDGPPLVDPDAEANGKLWSMNGKLGTAAALYNLVKKKGSVAICARHCVYGFNNTRHGHGGMFFNNFWTPIGAWAAGEKGFKHFMKGQIWWRELFRRADGSFNQVGRGKIGVSYALPYVAPKRRLRILDAPRSAFGTNCPAYLKPAMEAHKKRDYELCEKLILKQMNENILPAGDMPVVNHFLTSVRILRASVEHDLRLVEKLIEDGKYYYASLELPQLKGVVAADNARLKAIVTTLESEAGKAKIAEHRKKCSREEQAKKAAFAAANPRPKKEKWVNLKPDGVWQRKVVEHISHAPKGWTEPTYDDANWDKAKMPTSWTMYHTALYRTKFNVEDKNAIDGLRVAGKFFQQANVVIHLNGKVVAKIDEIGRGVGNTLAPFTDYGVSLLKTGENTIAVSSRHKRRWGSYRGTYKTASPMWFTVEARQKD